MGVPKVGYDLPTPQAKLEGKEYLQYMTKFKNLWWRRKKTHSSVLAWEIPQTEEPGRLQSMGSQESDTTERLSTRIFGVKRSLTNPHEKHKYLVRKLGKGHEVAVCKTRNTIGL